MKHKIHYLNNGKIVQNHIIKSTPIKSTKIKNINATNGKLFSQELTVASKKNNKADMKHDEIKYDESNKEMKINNIHKQ